MATVDRVVSVASFAVYDVAPPRGDSLSSVNCGLEVPTGNIGEDVIFGETMTVK